MKGCLPAIGAFTIFSILLSITIWVVSDREKNEAAEKLKIFEQGYVQACKDMHMNKLKYHLVEYEDGTRNWKKITK